MNKKKGILAYIKEIIVFFIMAGILVAFLSYHNWDLGAAIQWILDKTWLIIEKISNGLLSSDGFQKIAKS